MAHYLLQLSYVPEAWAALVRNPQDRAEAVRGPIENLGGKLERIWLAFGEDDVVGILDMPDNVAAAAISMAFSAGGACKNVNTPPLLSIQQRIEAMKKPAQCGYTPAHKPASAELSGSDLRVRDDTGPRSAPKTAPPACLSNRSPLLRAVLPAAASIALSSRALESVISRTACPNASSFALEGLWNPEIFRTNCKAAPLSSSALAVCPALRKTLMLLHMPTASHDAEHLVRPYTTEHGPQGITATGSVRNLSTGSRHCTELFENLRS